MKSPHLDDGLVFEWSDAIVTGVAEIDQEHRKIIDLLKKLQGLSAQNGQDEEVKMVLQGLRDYVEVHFAHEEALMDSFPYDNREAHKRAHGAFIRKLNMLERSFQSTNDRVDDLISFVYDWLVKHICSVDLVMVAKMNMGAGTALPDDAIDRQTIMVINGAFQTASQIERMTIELPTITDLQERELMRRNIAERSECLINIVTLANMRVDAHGCPLHHRNRLGSIKSALILSACNLANSICQRVINYGDAILSGQFGLPFGCGVVMRERLASVTALKNLLGDEEVGTQELRDSIKRAKDIHDAIVEMEKTRVQLPDFSHHRQGRRTKARRSAA